MVEQQLELISFISSFEELELQHVLSSVSLELLQQLLSTKITSELSSVIFVSLEQQFVVVTSLLSLFSLFELQHFSGTIIHLTPYDFHNK
ncbi:hypothetical protein NCCP28_35710 [Niallia sp. NCCP-28]|nr:hypothetical protein NCCP28_35710 [Niallia sp. NCCP-28]